MSTFKRKAALAQWCTECNTHEREHIWRCNHCLRALKTGRDYLPKEQCGDGSTGATLHCPESLPVDGLTRASSLGRALARELGPELEPEPSRLRAVTLDNTPAVDQHSFLRCTFCQRAIGIRIVMTKSSDTWLQVAAGAWLNVTELAAGTAGLQEERTSLLQVRCAQCLLPELRQ